MAARFAYGTQRHKTLARMNWAYGWLYDYLEPATAKTFRRRFTIKTGCVETVQTNKLVTVTITGDASMGAACQADGVDVIFTSEDGTTVLAFEKTSFSIVGGLATAVFKVGLPSVSPNGTTAFYMYYGDADAVDATSSVAGYAALDTAGFLDKGREAMVLSLGHQGTVGETHPGVARARLRRM